MGYNSGNLITLEIEMIRCWFVVSWMVLSGSCLAAKPVSLQKFIESYARQESMDIVYSSRLEGDVYLESGLTPASITLDEFYSVLFINGFSAYQGDGIINVTLLAKIRQHKIPFYDGENRGDLVQSQVVSSIIEIKNRSAAELVPILRPLLQQWGYIAADGPANALAVVTTVGNVERLRELVTKLDGIVLITRRTDARADAGN